MAARSTSNNGPARNRTWRWRRPRSSREKRSSTGSSARVKRLVCGWDAGFRPRSKRRRARLRRAKAPTRCAPSQKCISGPHTRSRPRLLLPRRRGCSGENSGSGNCVRGGQSSCFPDEWLIVETRLLILNPDPVFEDRALSIFDMIDGVETRIARTLSEAITILIEENFDAFVVEEEPTVAIEQATNVRQHFPSLRILCLVPCKIDKEQAAAIDQQALAIIVTTQRESRLASLLKTFIGSLDSTGSTAAEGIDPCHSLIGNLNQFSAAEILQMSCLSQRSGRFTFKSGRGNSEIYLQHGAVRHAVFGELEGESAVAEIFRWRQGRFYFEEGIISHEQTVDRPWAHLLIDNLQKLDETLELVSV